ncbi:MAG TPA: hypothetical protein PKD51_17625 [Saprospiraceae bacterium]|nr:hypothetical protein [Saprospiraceae bacterium]
MKIKFIFILYFLSVKIVAQDTINFVFLPKINEENLQLLKAYEWSKDTIEISQLKFYISDISLYQRDSLVHMLKKKYHLFDLSKKSTFQIIEKLNENVNFDNVKFKIGVDSLTHISGAMEGDLDPTNGMYWTWQSGYINFKLEGTSSISPARHHKFQWHIGGYQTPYNTIKEVTITTKDHSNMVPIEIHIDVLFRAVDLSQTYQIMSPNTRAMDIANLLPTVFKISVNEK